MSDDEEFLAIRVSAMPRDTNAHGTIFGGLILSLIDQAGAITAQAGGAGKLVTVAMREVVFVEPVFVGDVVSCYGRILRRGRTSITAAVRVEARAPSGGTPAREVTQAEVVYVQVDDDGRPSPLG
jgi:acyl-CoA thioesterase YciA